jgi:tRNA pseudouridine13 synthase
LPSDLAPRSIPLLTQDLPGTGGSVRVSEEDFRVEELPLYEPSGEGEHLYLTVEKRGRNTHDVVRELSAALRLPEREIGTAGLKDKRAVTVQRISLPARAVEGDPLALQGEGWRVLEAKRHGNKLRAGHLRGNRFSIVIRSCDPARAGPVCDWLRQHGAANLFGPQRFGQRQDNAALGAALLARDPAAARAGRDRFLRRLALSALQAELFNRCLSARIDDGLFAQAIDGDVLKKRVTGGLFVCADPAADTARVFAAEIDAAGPLPGHSLFAARGAALLREESVLADAAIDPRSFAAGGGEMEGARRPYRVPVEDLLATADGESLTLTFSLPRGSYAIAVLREVMKADADTPE